MPYHSTEDGKPGHVFLGAFKLGIPRESQDG